MGKSTDEEGDVDDNDDESSCTGSYSPLFECYINYCATGGGFSCILAYFLWLTLYLSFFYSSMSCCSAEG